MSFADRYAHAKRLRYDSKGNPYCASAGEQLAERGAGLVKNAWSKFMGRGDYTINTNSLFKSGGVIDQPQRIQVTGNGPRGTRIQFREYLGDVVSAPTANAFSAQTYALNPGQHATFPYLSNIAVNFEQWEAMGVVFEFVSTYSSDQGSLGSVIMATEYDPNEPPPLNKHELLNTAYSNSGKPTQHILHGIECAPRDSTHRNMFVRPLGDSTSNDKRDSDLGTFVIATEGCPDANARLGELYIHYDIVLRKEQLHGGLLARHHPLAMWSVVHTVGNINIDDEQLLGLDSTKSPISGTLDTYGTDTTGVFDEFTIQTNTTDVSLIWPQHLRRGKWVFTYKTYNIGAAYTDFAQSQHTVIDINGTALTASGHGHIYHFPISTTPAVTDDHSAFQEIILDFNTHPTAAGLNLDGATVAVGRQASAVHCSIALISDRTDAAGLVPL